MGSAIWHLHQTHVMDFHPLSHSVSPLNIKILKMICYILLSRRELAPGNCADNRFAAFIIMLQFLFLTLLMLVENTALTMDSFVNLCHYLQLFLV